MFNKTLALKIIFGISVAGLLFSGYLSYTELVQKVCLFGGCSMLLGLPVCVYGFVMYLAVLVVTVFGLRAKK